MKAVKYKKQKTLIAKKIEELSVDKFKKEIDSIPFKDSSDNLRMSLKNTIVNMPRISHMNMTILANAVAFCYDNSLNVETIAENLTVKSLRKYVDNIIGTRNKNFESEEKKSLAQLRLTAALIRYTIYYLKNIGLI